MDEALGADLIFDDDLYGLFNDIPMTPTRRLYTISQLQERFRDPRRVRLIEDWSWARLLMPEETARRLREDIDAEPLASVTRLQDREDALRQWLSLNLEEPATSEAQLWAIVQAVEAARTSPVPGWGAFVEIALEHASAYTHLSAADYALRLSALHPDSVGVAPTLRIFRDVPMGTALLERLMEESPRTLRHLELVAGYFRGSLEPIPSKVDQWLGELFTQLPHDENPIALRMLASVPHTGLGGALVPLSSKLPVEYLGDLWSAVLAAPGEADATLIKALLARDDGEKAALSALGRESVSGVEGWLQERIATLSSKRLPEPGDDEAESFWTSTLRAAARQGLTVSLATLRSYWTHTRAFSADLVPLLSLVARQAPEQLPEYLYVYRANPNSGLLEYSLGSVLHGASEEAVFHLLHALCFNFDPESLFSRPGLEAPEHAFSALALEPPVLPLLDRLRDVVPGRSRTVIAHIAALHPDGEDWLRSMAMEETCLEPRQAAWHGLWRMAQRRETSAWLKRMEDAPATFVRSGGMSLLAYRLDGTHRGELERLMRHTNPEVRYLTSKLIIQTEAVMYGILQRP